MWMNFNLQCKNNLKKKSFKEKQLFWYIYAFILVKIWPKFHYGVEECQ